VEGGFPSGGPIFRGSDFGNSFCGHILTCFFEKNTLFLGSGWDLGGFPGGVKNDHAKGGADSRGLPAEPLGCRSIFTSLCTGSGRNARPSAGGDFTMSCAAPHGEHF